MPVVGLDSRALESGFKAHAGRGTGRYAFNLINSLSQLSEGSDISVKLVGSKELARTKLDELLLRGLPFGRMTFSSQYLFPKAVARTAVDVIHFFAHGDAPARPQTPQIVTVLDLIPLLFRHLYKAGKTNLRFRFARYLEYRSIQASLGVVAISEATKRDVINHLGVPEDKIAVTPLGVDAGYLREGGVRSEEKVALKKLFSLPEDVPLLLYVGGIDPRKNVSFLLDILDALKTVRKPAPVLALAGAYSKDDQYPGLLFKIKKLGLASRVFLLGFVPEDRLPLLYQAADLFVFPSLYEGFGLPVIEALASGTPVVAGANSSLLEIGREVVSFCTDNDLEGWVREIKALLSSDGRLADVSAAGIARAKEFTWEKCARATLNAYRQFYDKGSRGR